MFSKQISIVIMLGDMHRMREARDAAFVLLRTILLQVASIQREGHIQLTTRYSFFIML